MSTCEDQSNSLLSLLTETQVSQITQRAVQTLRNDRFRRRGIPYIRLGGRQIRYRFVDVMAYIEARRIDPEGNNGG